MNRLDYGRLMGWRCGWPNCTVQREKGVHVHHVIPRTIGGLNRGWNFWVLCHGHHRMAERGLSTKTQFDLKTKAEISVLGRIVDERNISTYNFIKSRGFKAVGHLKGYDIEKSKAVKAGLGSGDIQIGGCSISLVEATYQEIDRVLQRTDKKRILDAIS